MHEENRDPMWVRVAETYHVPPETPREDMWSAISSRISVSGGDDGQVIDLAAARRSREARPAAPVQSRTLGWAVAAAALLVLGIGIGRMTAPAGPETVATAADVPARVGRSFTLAAQEHLGRTESLLTMVRADARSGRVDPATTEWAKGLLAQTRLLLDQRDSHDPALDDLLLDLELVLVQIVGVGESGSLDGARARTELELALRSLDEGEVLPRIQAVLPATMSGV